MKSKGCKIKWNVAQRAEPALNIECMDSLEQLFTIQQVSMKLNIPKPTLRFWEEELDGIIVPNRTSGGQRRYNSEHISIIEDIAYLKKRGMSLAEIRKQLGNHYKKNGDFSDSNNIDHLAERIAQAVRTEIYSFFEKKHLKSV
jgi:DNA-binding transcriptional MerR regulator